jgi:AhpD family alkylhydroperoxidase
MSHVRFDRSGRRALTVHDNVVKRRCTADQPDKVWFIGITQHRVRDGWASRRLAPRPHRYHEACARPFCTALLLFGIMSHAKVRADFVRSLEELDATVGRDLPEKLREMVRLRCSHINGCSYSVRLHSDGLAAGGVRVDLISALARPVKLMRADLVTEAEAAALRFAEILTDYPRGLELEARDEAAKYFTPRQLGSIVEVVAVVNAWNRVTRGSE